MPDITMCSGHGCPLKNRCYRFRALTHGRQDYFGRPPYDAASGRCADLWDLAGLAPTEARIRERAYHLWIAGGRRAGSGDADWQRASTELAAEAEAQLSPVADE
jgi:DUF2934 family protein